MRELTGTLVTIAIVMVLSAQGCFFFLERISGEREMFGKKEEGQGTKDRTHVRTQRGLWLRA